MSEPYRDNHLACPACHAPLRAYETRQVCDACNGIMLTLVDLAHGIWFDHEELAKVFEKVAGKGHGSGVATKTKSRDASEARPGGWSAMFKKFGGHGGW